MAKPQGGTQVLDQSAAAYQRMQKYLWRIFTQPGVAPQGVPVWQPPQGLDFKSPSSRIAKEHASTMLNFWIDRGLSRSRAGTSAVGSGVSNLMAVVNFIDASGVGNLIRFTTTKVQRWNGSSWIDVYSALTGGITDYFCYTAFGGKLIFSNGVDGMFEYDFIAMTVTALDGAPACRQLTTFDGRVIASGVVMLGADDATRVVWSVKNNSHVWPDTLGAKIVTAQVGQGDGTTHPDIAMLSTPIVPGTVSFWTSGGVPSGTVTDDSHGVLTGPHATGTINYDTGEVHITWDANVPATQYLLASYTFNATTSNDKLGSGYEDLLSTPGGQVDKQIGVWPATDTKALCVRGNSIWQMTATGNFDRPFIFDRLYDTIGCESPRSIDTIPGGIVGKFNDNFYTVSIDKIDAIGWDVKDTVLTETVDAAAACGFYDPMTQNYWFTNQSFVYRYSFLDKAWSRHSYPFTIRHMMRTRSTVSGLAIEDLTGPISGLVGAIKDLVGTAKYAGNYFASGGTSGYVIAEDGTVTHDADGAGGTADSPISITSGGLVMGSPLQRSQLVEVQYEGDVGESQTLLMEISRDGGANWETYSTVSAAAGNNAVIPFRNTIDAQLPMFRLSSSTLGKLRMIGLTAFGQPGAMINQ